MNTEELIKNLRQLLPLGPQIAMLVGEAADRLEKLQRLNDSMQLDRDLWIKVDRDEALANVEVLKLDRDKWQEQANLDAARGEQLRQALHDARVENSGQAALLDEARAEVERHKEAHAECRRDLAMALDKVENQEEISRDLYYKHGLLQSEVQHLKHIGGSADMIRPEPSRLEIAAMLVAGRFSATLYVTEVKGDWIKYALRGADALIAAAKEGK
jgi:hypothetical protein